MPMVIGDLKLYDINEIHEITGITKETLRLILRSGKLKGRKLAQKWLVTEDAFREFFEKGGDD